MQPRLYKKQQGVVLLWALAILLVLTLLSISSVKVSNLNTKISGNSMASMMVFQGAESALSKATNNNYINEAANATGRTKAVPAGDLPAESVSGGSLTSTATLSYIGYSPCPAVNGVAMSTNASPNAGSVTCQVYQVDAESRLKGTGAKTKHTLGVATVAPPTNAVNQ